MSEARGQSPRDDDEVPPITAEVPIKIGNTVDRIGHTISPRMVRPNDPGAAAAQEYYVATQVKKAAEARAAEAKAALMPLLKIPNSKGKHVALDSAQAMVMVDNRSTPRSLSADAVVLLLVKRFDLSLEQAQAAVEGIKTGGEGFVPHLSVVLK